MRFKVKGEFGLKGNRQAFEKVIEAESLKLAREKTYQLLGSQHSLQRSKIEIEDIEEI